MLLTNYKYKDGDSFPHAIAEGYKQAEKYWGISGAAGGFSEYAKNNKLKTTVGVVGIFVAGAAVTAIAAYFLSPAYATFVGTSLAKAAALVSSAITAMSASAIAHPLVASLIVVAAVAALITATVLAYKNNIKASQLEEVKKAVFDTCEKDNDKPRVDDGKLKFNDNNDVPTFLNDVAVAIGVVPAQKKI